MNENGNYLQEGWIDAETNKEYSMNGPWITPVYWLQKLDLHFYKCGINYKGGIVLSVILVTKELIL